MLDYKEIKEWDAKTSSAKVKEFRTELFNLRMQKTTSGLNTPHRLKELKKDIARILTAQNTKSEK